ncbi:MAG: GDP-mannose 4,6-dehydratase [Pirellulales bacterium]
MNSSDWRGRRVFVTGATGLLGASLVELLLEQQADVICLVRDWVPQSRLLGTDLLARVILVPGELEDLRCLERALHEYQVDTVFHLGAQTIVGIAESSPLSTFESNVRGTWNLLEACRRVGTVQRIVVASSDKAYGDQDKLPYTEEMPLLARNPYDASKACAELVARGYVASQQLPLAITRCGNLFGPGDLNFDRLVPGTIRAALHGERPIVRSDGEYVRDYFFVRDAARAYLLLAAALPAPRLHGEAFNFGYEQPVSVLEMVGRILNEMQRADLRPDVRNTATDEIRQQYLDCTKARRLLGWSPAFDLDTGLRETIAWYRKVLSP